MIIIAGTVTVKQGLRDEAMRAASDMVEATRAEPGCRAYAFYADLQDPHTFFLFEEWESEEALQRHFATPHMAAFRAHLPGLLAAPIAIKRYAVASAVTM